jgi:prepilin-type processing-associated H-X9-DG protein/prepilin-type N-terminal cleavage/methylation domain-containing protein
MNTNRVAVSRRGASGFTLIELIVSISIMATLAALLATGVARAKAHGQATLCQSNLHQIGVGLESFVSEFQRYPVNAGQTKPTSPGNSDRFWMLQIVRDGLSIPQPSPMFYGEGIWRCPSAKWTVEMQRANPTHFSDYGYNDDKFSGSGPKDSNKFGLEGHYSPATDSYSPIAESEVLTPSDMIAIGDCFEGNAILMRKSIETYATMANVRTRHLGKANILFCDGHSERPTIQSLFEDTSDTALRRWNRDHEPHLK